MERVSICRQRNLGKVGRRRFRCDHSHIFFITLNLLWLEYSTRALPGLKLWRVKRAMFQIWKGTYPMKGWFERLHLWHWFSDGLFQLHQENVASGHPNPEPEALPEARHRHWRGRPHHLQKQVGPLHHLNWGSHIMSNEVQCIPTWRPGITSNNSLLARFTPDLWVNSMQDFDTNHFAPYDSLNNHHLIGGSTRESQSESWFLGCCHEE